MIETLKTKKLLQTAIDAKEVTIDQWAYVTFTYAAPIEDLNNCINHMRCKIDQNGVFRRQGQLQHCAL